MKIKKINNILGIVALSFFLMVFNHNYVAANVNQEDFNKWLINFKSTALKKGISQETITLTLQNVKYLKNVIKYDRKQPEFFEDTITYISKRATQKELNQQKKY